MSRYAGNSRPTLSWTARLSIEIANATDAGAVHDALRPLEHRLLCEAVRLMARGAVRREAPGSRRLLVDV